MLRFANWSIAFLKHPIFIVIFPIFCLVWYLIGFGLEPFIYLLSVLAIEMSSLILLSTDHDTKAIHRKLAEIIHGVDKADDRIADIEKDEHC